MSSPLPRLNRTRRNPLCKISPSVPFKQQPPNSLSPPPPLFSPPPPSLLLRPPHHRPTSNDHSHDKIVRSIHQLRQTPGNDALLSSMATRLATVERELLGSKREIIEKENTIRILEEKLHVKETTSHTELRERCDELQHQVTEMERFLEDYGMVWVGEEEGVSDTSHAHPTNTWHPDSSTVDQSNATSPDLDFDKLVANVRQLNVLAGEDTAVVCKNVGGASLKMTDSVPLTLYRNGLVMFQGPFRPYSDPLTRACVSDLLDGYFPSELQSRYPEGVPFKLTDMRSCDYELTPIKARLFPGRGYTLHNDIPSSLSYSKDSSTCSYRETTLIDTPSDEPRPLSRQSSKATPTHSKTVSLDKFLSQIPKRIIKADGSIINIHSGLRDTLQALPIGQPTTVSAITAVTGHAHQSSSDDTTSLRIRFPNNKQVILKMKVTDTVDQLRQEIGKLMESHDMSHDYVIKGSFPRRSLTDDEMNLFQYDLTHSGNLFIQPLLIDNI